MVTKLRTNPRKKKRIIESEQIIVACIGCHSCTGGGTILVQVENEQVAVGCQPSENFVTQPRRFFPQAVPIESLPCRQHEEGENQIMIRQPKGNLKELMRTTRINPL